MYIRANYHSKNMNSFDNISPKPFVKWVGGKTQLLPEIEERLSDALSSEGEKTYVEPFVGGGAALFYLLNKYKNIKNAVINDINPRLMVTYTVIKNNPIELISILRELQNQYLPLSHEARTEMYLKQRDRFNLAKLSDIEIAALFIFLNRTCFNGLYRENKQGKFNVPHGRYEHPLICDEQTILCDSKILQRVKIHCGDFSEMQAYANRGTIFYFDPPYKPLSDTSSFNSYVKQAFDDDEQARLRDFVDQVARAGCLFVLSNSDVKAKDTSNNFFDNLYSKFEIDRVWASRMVNANPQKRGKLTELMISNRVTYI